MSSVKENVRWLHISDLHFKAGEVYDRDVVLHALIESFDRLINRVGKPDLIFVSGDIANAGLDEEYNAASLFFDKMIDITKLSKDKIIIIPGNHDVNRQKGRGLGRTINNIRDIDNYFDSSEPLLHVSQRQKSFKEWYNRYFNGIRVFKENTTCQDIVRFNINSKKISILPINTAAFCLDDNDHSKLLIGRRCLSPACEDLEKDDCDLRIALIHHPLEWLNPIESSNIRSLLYKSTDCILTGHLHETNAEQIFGLTGSSIHLAAGATYQTQEYPNTAMFCELCDNKVIVSPIRFENTPTPRWVIDPSIFPDDPLFKGYITMAKQQSTNISEDSSHSITQVSESVIPVSNLSTNSLIQISSSVQDTRNAFEQDLFMTASESRIYIEPRIFDKPQSLPFDAEDPPNAISVRTIVESSESYLIESRPEHGATTLCQRFALELAIAGCQNVYVKDARKLPNYRKKLEAEFPENGRKSLASVLILDNIDLDRDERLLRELHATSWFKRILAITVNRSLHQSEIILSNTIPFSPKTAFLWPIHRADIRTITAAFYRSADPHYVSKIVEKVYQDLLNLGIPLTPSNVIMYLRILHKEGEFSPLNRVDIVGRYLQELLRTPSDAYTDFFSSKNKIDVISSFAYKLYQDRKPDFDEKYWFDFTAFYKADTLTDFSDADLLDELLEARVIVKWGSSILFKYRFFYTYFLGRHIALHASKLDLFLKEEDNFFVGGLIDAITGLSSENTAILTALTERLEGLLDAFADRYFDAGFDPLAPASWPSLDKEEERLWKPIAAEIEAGIKSGEEIDAIKTSLVSESMTADQRVKFAEFKDLEYVIFFAGNKMLDALRNSNDVSGHLKLRAFNALLRERLISLQVGSVFWQALSKERLFSWGGIAFLGFDKHGMSDKHSSLQIAAHIINSVSIAISTQNAEMIGLTKLGPVFNVAAKATEDLRFIDVLNFNCILVAKGKDWDKTLMDYIRKAGRERYYLYQMLMLLTSSLKVDTMKVRDRESIKKLIATIRAKRITKTDDPGAKAIARSLRDLEESGNFTSGVK